MPYLRCASTVEQELLAQRNEPMSRSIKVIAVPRENPDLDQFVAALLAMAVARLNEEKAKRAAEMKETDREDA